MFDSVENYIKELESDADYTQRFVQRLAGGRKRLSNSIIKAEDDVKEAKNEVKYVAKLKPQISKLALQAAKDILFGEAIQAIRENYEFDAPPYRNSLFTAVEDSSTYLIRPKGSGFNSIITIDINLDKSAGRLNMWAAGVKAYRKVLEDEKKAKASNKKGKKQKVKKYDPIAASRAWARIFERRAGTFSKFSETVRNRIELSGAIAPFWQLLDKGETPLKSDRGGYATPKGKPTNFVNNAEIAANAYTAKLLLDEKRKYDQLMSGYQTLLDNAISSLIELDSLIDEIRLDRKQIEILDKKSAKALKVAYDDKLQKAVQLIREGLLSSKQLQVATKGSYKGKRFSMETMKEILQ